MQVQTCRNAHADIDTYMACTYKHTHTHTGNMNKGRHLFPSFILFL